MKRNIFDQIKLGKYQEVELDINISAFEVFKRLYPFCENIFLLESLGEEGKYNRYSYVGFDPLITIVAKGNEIYLEGKAFTVANPYQELAAFSKFESGGSGFCGGLVGYLSYEATNYFEEAFQSQTNYDFANFQYGFYIDGLKFDKKTKKCTYFFYGNSRLKQLMSFIHESGKIGNFSFRKISVNKTINEYKEMFQSAHESILRGDIFQVVLSMKTHYLLSGDKRKIYASLRQVNPSAYMFYFKFREREIITASPELLIKVKGKYIEHLGTLAGTIERGTNSLEDQKLQSRLKKDEKETAEHMMLVDLARNDLGKICKFDSIRVKNLASIKRLSHVQHLSSEVKGELKDNEDAFSALAACFPAGTLSGAPKIEATKIINKLENEVRGPYGGVGGYFSLNGEAMQAIIIRSLFINGDHGYTQTGSGIVADSNVEGEYQEIVNKQKAMEEALRRAQGETLRQAQGK